MKDEIRIYIRKLNSWFNKLNPRESALVVFTAVCLFVGGIYFSVDAISQKIKNSERLAIVRKRDMENLDYIARRYKTLNSRLNKLQESFAQSEMTFEEVTSQLDSIVRKSIGSDDYELKKGRSPTKIGFEYEKQQFTLKINSLTLQQVVNLLHGLEQGESPLILGKVDVRKLPRSENFATTLEIFSVRKSRA